MAPLWKLKLSTLGENFFNMFTLQISSDIISVYVYVGVYTKKESFLKYVIRYTSVSMHYDLELTQDHVSDLRT